MYSAIVIQLRYTTYHTIHIQFTSMSTLARGCKTLSVNGIMALEQATRMQYYLVLGTDSMEQDVFAR